MPMKMRMREQAHIARWKVTDENAIRSSTKSNRLHPKGCWARERYRATGNELVSAFGRARNGDTYARRKPSGIHAACLRHSPCGSPHRGGTDLTSLNDNEGNGGLRPNRQGNCPQDSLSLPGIRMGKTRKTHLKPGLVAPPHSSVLTTVHGRLAQGSGPHDRC